MRIVFVGEKEKNIKLENIVFTKNSITLIGFGYLPEISLDDELRSSSNYIKTLCSISLFNNLTFLATTTVYCGRKKFFGTLIIDNGKLVGISDMTHSTSGLYDKSNSLCVFPTSFGRLGVITGEDINYFEVSRLMKLWECDCFFFGIDSNLSRQNKILAEAQGYINQTTSVIFGSNGLNIYNSKTLVKKSKYCYEITTKSDNNLINSRRKEMYRDLVIR